MQGNGPNLALRISEGCQVPRFEDQGTLEEKVQTSWEVGLNYIISQEVALIDLVVYKLKFVSSSAF